MSLLSVIIAVAASGFVLSTLLLVPALHFVLHRLRRYEPAVRLRWLLVLGGAGPFAAVLAVLVAFGPCLRRLALGLDDGCRSHGGPDFFFCLRMPMHPVPLAWGVAAVVVGILGFRIARSMRAVLRANGALRRLRQVGVHDAMRDVWIVPGELAFVSGWPRSEVYIGQEVEERLEPSTLTILLAHERAHRTRGDVTSKLAARILTSLLPSFMRNPLLDEIDLAMEQACDAMAADVVTDPLEVARTLLDLAGSSASNELALAFCASENHLEARVRALCEPQWRSSFRPAAALIAIGVIFTTGCIFFDPSLHDAFEAVFERVLG